MCIHIEKESVLRKRDYVLGEVGGGILRDGEIGYIKGTTTFSITTLNITTFSIIALSIKGLFVTHSKNDIPYN